ncbi:MAG: competence protein CoiA [Microcoleaceae cyanobacterium]
MPLTALHKPSGQRLISCDFSESWEINKQFKKGDLVCPFCGIQMFPRGGISKQRTLHFVHTSECTTTLGYHPESPEHLAGKVHLAKLLKAQISEYSDVEIIIEYPMPSAGKNGRIADVAALWPSGWVTVYECQLSAISPIDLEMRTIDYERVGADVFWFFGGNANTLQNQNWSKEYFGSCYFIEFEDEKAVEVVLQSKQEAVECVSEGKDNLL